MVMIVECLKNSIGKIIVFYIGERRFEGKILDCDDAYLKYYDTHKDREAYKKLTEISEWEVLDGKH